MKVERRHITTEFRVSDPDQPTTISGYAAVFESPASNGLWTEVLDPHCFDNVLASTPDVRCLKNHDPNLILGRTAANTLSLTVDARGLSYDCNPAPTSYGNDLLISMRRKDITGSSFGFICKRDQWTDNSDGTVTRRILEVEELLDVSPVTYPFYPSASSTVRSLPDSIPVEIRSRFEQNAESPILPSPDEVEDEWQLNATLKLRLAEAL